MKIRRTGTQLNNKGFSLVELIVVIAIMVVLVAAVVASSSMMDSSYVKDAERGIKDYISTARSKSMSVVAKEWCVKITKEDDSYVVQLIKTVEEDGELKTKIVDSYDLGKKIIITFGDQMKVGVDETTPLSLYFNSSTGKISKVLYGDQQCNISSGLGYIGIKCGSYDIVLKVFYNTGKCERE